MSDSMFFPEEGNRERGIKRLQQTVTFGSTSIGSQLAYAGVTVTRSNAGEYTATLADSFVAVRGISLVFNANSTTPVDLQPQVYSVSAADKVVKFKLLTGSVATDPSSGAELYLTLTLKDSSENP
jgi:hypothetical protein